MVNKLKNKSVLSLYDLTIEEIEEILKTTDLFKTRRKTGQEVRTLDGKVVALIFQKPSTRTKVSFLSGISQLGGTPLYLDARDLQLGRGETVADTAHVLSRYVDAIVARVYSHHDLEELASKGSVPVINALSDDYHPCQVLADLYTMYEKIPQIKGIKLSNYRDLKIAYTGDGNSNMAHEILLGAAKTGMNISLASSKEYQPKDTVLEKVMKVASETRAKIEITDNPLTAATGANVLYTDILVSMGEDALKEQKLKALIPYQLNEKLLEVADKDAIVMHPLPAHRGEEISAVAMEGPHSVIWDQAENRLHAQKALLSLILA